MKKFINILSMLAVITLLFSACGSKEPKNESITHSTTTQPLTTAALQTVPETTEQEDDFAPTNKDGVIELQNGDCRALKPCYDTVPDDKYILVFKSVNSTIPKIKKDATVGIYNNNYETIDVLPVDVSHPRYTVNLNFYFLNKENVHDYPERFLLSQNFSAYKGTKDSQYLALTSPITECNGEDLTKFVNQNSEIFYYMRGITSHDGYKLLTAKKDQQFEFGGYVGTQWESITVKADVEYYKVNAYSDDNEKIKKIPVEKTKNGYFTVDFSGLKSGVYYILTYDTFVEIV